MEEKIKEYAKCLCEEDPAIEEVVLIGNLADGTATKKSDVDLICVFDEELEEGIPEDSVGVLYKRVHGLREKLHRLEAEIEYPIDLGFILSTGEIFMGGGLISKYRGKYKTLIKREAKSHGVTLSIDRDE